MKAWCDKHSLSQQDYKGLKKLGFCVAETQALTSLELSTWVWAGIPPLRRARILEICAVEKANVLFHDREDPPRNPTTYITNVTGHTQYDVYPADWPSPELLRERTVGILSQFYDHHFPKTDPNPWNSIPCCPLTISRPAVEEIGGVIHECVKTSAWVNLETQAEVGFLRAPLPTNSLVSNYTSVRSNKMQMKHFLFFIFYFLFFIFYFLFFIFYFLF